MHERAKAERERAHTAAYQAAVEEVRNCDDGCDGFGRVDVEAEGQSAVVSCGCAKRITLDELSESRCAERQGIPGDEQAFGDGRNDLDSAERAALEARADRIMREAYDR